MTAGTATPRQLEVLKAIQRLKAKRGFPPTIRELGDDLGISSSHGVACHLGALIERGLLTRERKGSARSIRITPAGERALGA